MIGQDLVLRRIVVTTATVPSNDVVGIIRSSLGSCESIRLSPGRSNQYVVKSSFSGRLACRWARRLSLLGMLMLWCSGADAHEIITTKITWAREISRVFSRRCLSCHRNGGPAFDLSSYQEARPWAEAIKQEVLERRMPPWGAVKGFGDFRDDDGLSETEIVLISNWVEGGAPQGDLNLLPKEIKTQAVPSVHPKVREILLVNGSLTLDRSVRLAAVRPEALHEGASLRVIAEHPRGGVEPLIWIYNYASRFSRTYYFKVPVNLGAGTRIQLHPAIGSVSLLLGG